MPSHSVLLTCLWAARGPLSLHFFPFLCPASRSSQGQRTNLTLAQNEIFFYTSKTGLWSPFPTSVESLEKGPSCSWEIDLGALGDLCRRSPNLCWQQGPRVGRAREGLLRGWALPRPRPRAALDRRAHGEVGVGPLQCGMREKRILRHLLAVPKSSVEIKPVSFVGVRTGRKDAQNGRGTLCLFPVGVRCTYRRLGRSWTRDHDGPRKTEAGGAAGERGCLEEPDWGKSERAVTSGQHQTHIFVVGLLHEPRPRR